MRIKEFSMTNKTVRNIAIIALMTVIGFAMTACGGPGDLDPQTAAYSGISDGTTYTLTITENTARYMAKYGDSYALTAGPKKSTGMVTSYSGGVFTLKPEGATKTFTAKITGGNLIGFTGSVTWDGDSEPTVLPPSVIPIPTTPPPPLPDDWQTLGFDEWLAWSKTVDQDSMSPTEIEVLKVFIEINWDKLTDGGREFFGYDRGFGIGDPSRAEHRGIWEMGDLTLEITEDTFVITDTSASPPPPTVAGTFKIYRVNRSRGDVFRYPYYDASEEDEPEETDLDVLYIELLATGNLKIYDESEPAELQGEWTKQE